jgi:hypothetical protein
VGLKKRGKGFLKQGEKGKRGKGEKGENLGFLLPPVFPARLKAIIAQKTLV